MDKNKNTRGASSKYETYVKEKFDQISEWLKLGATDKEIIKNLGINKSTFYKYKKNHEEFNNLLKNGRKQPILEIKSAMFKRATGYEYKETKTVTQMIKYEDGSGKVIPAKLIKTEETTKTALPDTTAQLILLQHWDLDKQGNPKWSRDPSALRVKLKELELKQKNAERDNW